MKSDKFIASDTPIEGDTKTFDKVTEDNKYLYNNTNGEEPLFVFERVAATAYATVHKRMKWFNYSNTRLIVYFAFFIALSVFSAYFFIKSDYLIAAFAAIASVFMAYIIAFGHKLFVTALECDELGNGAQICCKITSNNIFLIINNKFESVPFNNVKLIHNKKHLLFSFKKSAICKDGLVFDVSDHNVDEIKRVLLK